MYYLAIYYDGNHVTRPNIESVFSLPGHYYAFSIGKSIQVNDTEGITFYNSSQKPDVFRLENLELIDIESRSNFHHPYKFSIYDHNTNTVKILYAESINIINTLSTVVSIIHAKVYPPVAKSSQLVQRLRFLSRKPGNNGNVVLAIKGK